MSVWPLQEFSPHPAAQPQVDVVQSRHAAWFRPPSWRKALLLAAIILALAAVAFWTWSNFLRPIEVQTAPGQTDVREQVFGLGTVGARVASNVGFKVAGVLVDLKADHGDHVRAGAVLARLDARDVEAQLAVAQAGVSQAEANIAKAKADVESAQANLDQRPGGQRPSRGVWRGRATPRRRRRRPPTRQCASRAPIWTWRPARVGVANATLEAAQAQQDFAQATLDNYTLRAPYDALVVSRNLQLGSMPVPGQAVFTLVDPQTIWVLGYVDERLAGRLQLGQQAEIVLRSRPGERLPGHVARIEIQSDAVNEERLVEVAFDQIPPDIHLAEQAEVFITTGVLARAVLVPPTAVTGLARTAAGRSGRWSSGQLAQRRRVVRTGIAGRTAADRCRLAGRRAGRVGAAGRACASGAPRTRCGRRRRR